MSVLYPELVLARDPEGNLALAGPVDSFDEEAIEQYKATPTPSEKQRYALVGRSSLAMVAAIEVMQGKKAGIVDNDILYLSTLINTYNPIGAKMMERVEHTREVAADGELLTWEDEHLSFGRVVDQGGRRQLEPDELAYAIDEELMGFGDAYDGAQPTNRIVDGCVAVPLAPWENKPHPSRLKKDRNMLNVILHGRNFALDNMYTVPRKPTDKIGDYIVGSALFSPGQYDCEIVGLIGQNDESIPHNQGATTIDAERIMGIGDHIPRKQRGQQAEIVNIDQAVDLNWGDAEVLVRVHKNEPLTSWGIEQKLSPIVFWEDLGIEKRRRIHRSGYNIAQIIEPVLEPILATIGNGNCATVMTSRRMVEVPDDEDKDELPDDPADSPNMENIRDVLLSTGQRMETPSHLRRFKPVQRKLGLATNDPRIIFARDIAPPQMAELMQQGNPNMIVVAQDDDIVLEAEDEAALLKLTREGKKIAWYNEGELQLLHPTGFRANRKDYDLLSETITDIYAMFGSHKEEVGEFQRPDIHAYRTALTAGGLIVAKLAFIHGDGPGIMRVTGEEGRAGGIKTIGAGVQLDEIGQIRATDQRQDIRSINGKLSRLPRQGKLLKVSDWRKFWIGAAGTIGEEFGIDVTNVKLNDCFPTIFSMIAGDHYKEQKQQFDKLATKKKLKFNGRYLDLGETRLLQPYVAEAIRLYESAEDAAKDDLECSTVNGLCAFWEEIDVPKEDIERSLKNRRKTLKRLGRPLLNVQTQAAEHYINTGN